MTFHLDQVPRPFLPHSIFPNAYFRLIGDVHGRIHGRPRKLDRDRDRRLMPAIWKDPRVRGRSYIQLAESSQYSLQVGDLSLDYSELRGIDPRTHRAIAGNHDHMQKLTPHFLGDFGIWNVPLRDGTLDIFFVRGAASVDLPYRVEGLNWWFDEELFPDQMEKAIQTFQQVQPMFVVTHDCPTELLELLVPSNQKLPPSRTNTMLQAMLEVHAPQWWFFGHHHKNLTFQHPRGTRFVCLASLAYFDFDETGRSVSWKPE